MHKDGMKFLMYQGVIITEEERLTIKKCILERFVNEKKGELE